MRVAEEGADGVVFIVEDSGPGPTAADPTCRIGRPDVVNHYPRALDEPKVRIPGQQVDIGEHVANLPFRVVVFGCVAP